MRKISYKGLFFILVALSLVSGCFGDKKLTPIEQSTWMMTTYNTQYTNYMIITGYTKDDYGKWIKTYNPELSENTKNLLRKKKDILVKVKPLIKIYTGLMIEGDPVSSETELAIITLLNSL